MVGVSRTACPTGGRGLCTSEAAYPQASGTCPSVTRFAPRSQSSPETASTTPRQQLLQSMHGTCLPPGYKNKREHSSFMFFCQYFFAGGAFDACVSRELARARRKQLLALSPPTLALPSGVVAAGRAASCARLRRAKPVRHANVRALRRPLALLVRDEAAVRAAAAVAASVMTRTRGGMGRPPRQPAGPRSRPARQGSARRRMPVSSSWDPPSVARRERAPTFLRVSAANLFPPRLESAAGFHRTCPIAAAWAGMRRWADKHRRPARSVCIARGKQSRSWFRRRRRVHCNGRTTAGKWRSARTAGVASIGASPANANAAKSARMAVMASPPYCTVDASAPPTPAVIGARWAAPGARVRRAEPVGHANIVALRGPHALLV